SVGHGSGEIPETFESREGPTRGGRRPQEQMHRLLCQGTGILMARLSAAFSTRRVGLPGRPSTETTRGRRRSTWSAVATRVPPTRTRSSNLCSPEHGYDGGPTPR